ncbi:MAG TPA: hypothetical protein VFE53_03800 [Mucilaginibacter sp.]|jgi:hypothetical protein|nr:hypothetical protein [Mucilaginibacter sp.]
MKDLTIRWELVAGQPEQVKYFVNELNIGNGDKGFDRIIDMLKENPQIEKVTLKPTQIAGLGGESFGRTLPFRGRYDEFKKILGQRTLLIDFL